ncbi:MAG: tripartite tricarboxylate transporter substrate binding protein [Chryseobacterium sp.]|uniref:Bug family tripartite tricarboxylate transporter substrate binding protein n=1 Tax=Chryseobacterium sp. TaxID=1871047 RepID=UPI002FCADC30
MSPIIEGKNMKFVLKMVAVAALFATSSVAMAAYPDKPIRLIIPFAANGATDVLVRIIADPLGKELGQPLMVENIGGEGGKTGTFEGINSEPDGYTLVATTISSIISNTAYNKNVGYDPLADFQHISNIADVPNILVVRKDFPANNFKEFLEEVKKSKGKYSYASSGQGGIQHFLMEYFKTMTKTNINHIPYRGGGPAVKDASLGRVDMILDQMSSAYSYVQKGDLKAIALSAPYRSKILPDVPTFKDLGMEEMNIYTYYGLSGPKGLNPAIAKKISDAMIKVINQPDIKAKIEATGAYPNPNTPEQFTKMFAKDKAVFEKIVREAKLVAR